jgi:hypothetical protein
MNLLNKELADPISLKLKMDGNHKYWEKSKSFGSNIKSLNSHNISLGDTKLNTHTQSLLHAKYTSSGLNINNSRSYESAIINSNGIDKSLENEEFKINVENKSDKICCDYSSCLIF